MSTLSYCVKERDITDGSDGRPVLKLSSLWEYDDADNWPTLVDEVTNSSRDRDPLAAYNRSALSSLSSGGREATVSFS